MTDKVKIGVMFVCLGNICRSPMAEAVFSHLVCEARLRENFEIQSSGIGSWHVGERPHPGTVQVLKQHQISVNPNKRAQQIKKDIFSQFDYVVAMDQSNQQDLKPFGEAVLLLDGVANIHTRDVPDPYYGKNFEVVFELVLKGCTNLLERILSEKALDYG
jgi:protein-tyrosine phosphatase